MAFTAKDVQALREKTGVGMMDCKKALVETDGDMDKAIEILREKGLASAAKKASRVAAEGAVATYYDGKSAAMVEINCETDFVSKGEPFIALANKIAKTAALSSAADVDALLKAKTADEDCTVEEAIQEVFLALRENMKLRRFVRIEGHVASYIHAGGSVGVLVEFDTDDATAEKAEFKEMGKNVAMQIAAMNPEYLCKEAIPEDELAKMKTIIVESSLNKPESLPRPILKSVIEKTIADKKWDDATIAVYEEQKNNKFLFNFLSEEAIAALAQTAVENKDEYMANPIFSKASEGRIAKQIKEVCLLEQGFVRSDLFDGNVKGYVASVAKQLSADIAVKSFVRYEKGEGIEKKEENFADEIASLVK